jgi:hypothetical protein
MKANQLRRLERLEALAMRTKEDNKIYESFWMDNNKVIPESWTQKAGRKRGEPIVFETVRAALAWVVAQGLPAQVFSDDIRDLMSEVQLDTFNLVFQGDLNYRMMFDLHRGQANWFRAALRVWTVWHRGRPWWGEAMGRLNALQEVFNAL